MNILMRVIFIVVMAGITAAAGQMWPHAAAVVGWVMGCITTSAVALHVVIADDK